MDLYNLINSKNFISEITASDKEIKNILSKDFINYDEFIKLLSIEAGNHLEEMAIKSKNLTLKYFGNAIQVFSPLYISNYCENDCSYCGYRRNSKIKRKQLTLDEIEKEAKAIHSTGIRQVLLLTGESKKTGFSFILDAVKVLKRYFPMIGIEIRALTFEEYKQVYEAGARYLTIYQETYDVDNYNFYHKSGPKSDFKFRLLAPSRAAENNFIGVNLGPLLGLSNPVHDVMALGFHLDYLRNRYPELELSLSLPRLRPTKGGYKSKFIVSDRLYVQFLLALRIFLPRAGITLSTRENENFRKHLLNLGVTKMSAGVKTSVGGYSNLSDSKDTEQFSINDESSVKEVCSFLEANKKQAVFNDWFKE